jgi:hypothetical protein
MHTTIVALTCPVPECTLTVADIESLLPALDTFAEQYRHKMKMNFVQ